MNQIVALPMPGIDERAALTRKIRSVMRKRKLSYREVAEAGGMSPVFTTACCPPRPRRRWRNADPNSDRVKLTMSGKFLKYKKY
jgi:cyanate lyase